jgi:glucose uptake protein GlcU
MCHRHVASSCVIIMCHGVSWQVLALVFTLGTAHPGLQSLLLTLLCLGFTVLHCNLAPLRDEQSNHLQTILMVCLTALALCSCPAADAIERSSPSDAQTVSDGFSRVGQTLFGVVVPVMAVAWAVLGTRVRGALAAALSFLVQR